MIDRRSFLPARVFLAVLTVALVSGCSSASKKLRHEIRDDFVASRFSDVDLKLHQPELLSESKNRLVTLFDLGMVAHAQGQYERSNRYFYRAKEIAKELYTDSVTEQILTGIKNDTSATYPGTDYENGLVYYYIVLNHLMMAQAGKIPAWEMPELKIKDHVVFAHEAHAEKIMNAREKKEALGRARAEVLAWDSFLQTVRNRNKGEPYYKDDLLAKILAAYVHRMIGGRDDLQTAKILIQDADKLLVKSYSSYAAFNTKHEQYVSNYSKFEQMGDAAVTEQMIDPTDQYKGLSAMLDRAEKQPGNVMVLIDTGIIPEKKEKVYTVGLSSLFGAIEDPKLREQLESVSTRVLLEMAPRLGLMYVSASVLGAATSSSERSPHYISEAADRMVGFEFKLPTIEKTPSGSSFKIVATRQSDSKVFEFSSNIVEPINDIAYLNVERRSAAVVTKTAIRVGMKQLAAVLGAIAVYRKAPDPEWVKALAATAAYVAAKKLIDSSEEADTRAWNLLPREVQIAQFQLEPGIYRLRAEGISSGSSRTIDLGVVEIKDIHSPKVLSTRVF